MRGTRRMMAAKRCGTHGAPCNALSSVPIRNCIPRSTISSAWCQHATSRILSVGISGPCRSFFERGREKREREKKERNNRKLWISLVDGALPLDRPSLCSRSNICLDDEAFAFRQWWTYTLVARQRIFLPVLRLIPIIGSSTPSDDELTTVYTGEGRFVIEHDRINIGIS